MSVEKYHYKGNDYYLQEYSSFKHPQTREWIECVIYYGAKDGKIWVREKQEFFKLFKLVE